MCVVVGSIYITVIAVGGDLDSFADVPVFNILTSQTAVSTTLHCALANPR